MSRSRSRGTLLALALGVGCGALIANTGNRIESKPEPGPMGAALIADSARFDELLAALAQLEGTPIARHARSLRASLPDCPRLEGYAASGRLSDLLPSLGCSAPVPDRADLEALRAGRDLLIALPVPGGRLVGALTIDSSGDLLLDLTLPRAIGEGLAGLALPGSEAPGRSELNDSGTLIHARIRSAEPLDLASWVPPDSQGARMFRLKSELFAGLVLDDTWEIAVYLPTEGDSMPRAALALNFKQRSAAVAAMEDFIDKLQDSWQVNRTFFRIDSAEGACLLDLRLLPELAPCYLAGERALIIGWNPASLHQAMADPRGELSGLGDNGGAVIHLERFAEADRILSRALSVEGASAPRAYPWSRVVATGATAKSEYRLKLRFEVGAGT